MTTKKLLSFATSTVLIALIAGVFVYANTRPVIPADTMQPDLDPATATPAEWRAQAERIIKAASAVMPLVSEELDRDGVPHKDTLRHYLGCLYAEVGEAQKAADLFEELTLEEKRVNGWANGASGPAGVGDVGTIEDMLALAPNAETRMRVKVRLVEALANADDLEGAVELYAHPDLTEFVERTPISATLNRLHESLVRAGMMPEARNLIRQAENLWAPTGDTNLDQHIRGNLAELYIRAQDFDAALRIIEQMNPDYRIDQLLGELAKQQARSLDLEGASETRNRIEDLPDRAYACTYAARDLAKAGEEEAARSLFSEAIRIADEMEVEWGYGDTMTNESMLIHIARYQHEGGLHDDAAKTTRSAFELVEQQHDNEFYKAEALAELLELLLEIEQPDLSREVYERTAAIVLATAQSDGDACDLLIILGQAAAKLDKPDASAEHFRTAIEIAKKIDPDPDRPSEPNAAFVLRTAVAQSESGQQDDASEAFTLALRLHKQADESDRDDIRDGIAQGLILSGRITAALYIAEQIEDPYARAFLLCEMAGLAVDKAKSDKYWAIHGD